MNIYYHIITIDGHETLAIGGAPAMDDGDYIWLTSIQGEKMLHVPKADIRAVTRDEATAFMRVRREAGLELEAVGIAVNPVLSSTADDFYEMPKPKQCPLFPRADRPDLN